eukprot:COSAG05_NODE_23904_length_255_cov_0.621795_1_plen_53_part_10
MVAPPPAEAEPQLPAQRVSSRLGCGFAAGLTTAGLLNPWDRALYLSVKELRPF